MTLLWTRLRAVVIISTCVVSLVLGWMLLWQTTEPNVARGVGTPILMAVLALQAFPVLGIFTWRWDRSASRPDESASEGGSGTSARIPTLSTVTSEVTAVRSATNHNVIPVHRVVHQTRGRNTRSGKSVNEQTA
jgi:hypothetical protein